MLKRYNVKLPLILFLVSNIVGISIGKFVFNYDNSMDFPKPGFSASQSLSFFIEIFPHNLMVIIIALFVLRIIWYLKNKVFKSSYDKVDIKLYHFINSIIIINTGVQLGYSVESLNSIVDYSTITLYIFGILPHGITEILALLIVFDINRKLIHKKEFSNPFKFKKTDIFIPVGLIFFSAILESTITPILLYTDILIK